MPGKKVGEYGWRYLSRMQLLRDVAVDDDPLNIDAIPESIDHFTGLEAAYQNAVAIAAMIEGPIVSATIAVYVNPKALDGVGAEIVDEYRWCKLTAINITESEIVMLNDVPPGIIKVVVTNIVHVAGPSSSSASPASSESSASSASPGPSPVPVISGIRISYAKST